MGLGGRAGRWSIGRSKTLKEVAQGGVHGSIEAFPEGGEEIVAAPHQNVVSSEEKGESQEAKQPDSGPGALPQGLHPPSTTASSPSAVTKGEEMPSKPVQAAVHEVQPLIKGAGAVVVIDAASKREEAAAALPKYQSVDPEGHRAGGPPAPRPLLSPFMRQVLAASGTVIATVSSGMTSGFSAVLLPQLSAPDSNFRITVEEGSWIASTAALPMAPGCLLGGLLMEKIGRRLTIILLCIPFALGWIVEAAAPDVLALCFGRALTGLGVGLLGAPGMVYIGETSSPANRGFLLASVSLAVSIGVAASHLIGALLPWRTAAGIFAVVPMLAALLSFLSPESPLWLASRGKMREAAQVFRMLRGSGPEAEKELEALLNKSGSRKPEDEVTLEDGVANCNGAAVEVEGTPSTPFSRFLHRWGMLLRRPSFIKPFLIMNLFFFVQQWCGVNAVTFYTVDIFKATAAGDTGATVDEYTATGAVDAARILASIAACILLRKCGRRPLAMASGLGSGISLIALAVFLILKTPHTDVSLDDDDLLEGIDGGQSSAMVLGAQSLGKLLVNSSAPALTGDSELLPSVANHTLTLAEEVVEDVVDAATFVWVWAPVVCLVLYVLFSTIGLIPLPWVMTGEVFPVAGRGFGSGVTSCVGFLAFFSVVKTAPALFGSLDMGGAFCVYGGVVLVGTVLLHFCLPETRGRTLQEIEEAFGGSEVKRKVKKTHKTAESGSGVV